MTYNRKAYPSMTCEGPLGFPMSEEGARQLEDLLRKQPCGRQWQYQRGFAAKATTEFLAGERADVSVITSTAVDHDREVVLPSGIDLSGFRKNPVVTFAHRYDQLPLGRALWIKQEQTRIKAKTRYSTRPEGWVGEWLPDAVWHMVQSGDLRGKSIGFLPLEGHPPDAQDIRQRPELAGVHWIYTRSLLLEYAVAPVQSNPEAMVEAVAKGIFSVETANNLRLRLAKEPSALTDHTHPSTVALTAQKCAGSRTQVTSESGREQQPWVTQATVPERFLTAEHYRRAAIVGFERAIGRIDLDRLVGERLDRARGRV